MTDGLSEAYEERKWDVFCENNDLLLENDQLKSENAKLRELCAGLWTVMWACAEQRCPHRHEDCYVVRGNGVVSGNGGVPKSHGECWYKQRMREMGVSAE